MNKEEITKKIIEERKVKGMTRQQLAKASGLTYNFLRMFENGGNISLSNLLKITKELNLDFVISKSM